jgi:hypothetical protein
LSRFPPELQASVARPEDFRLELKREAALKTMGTSGMKTLRQ